MNRPEGEYYLVSGNGVQVPSIVPAQQVQQAELKDLARRLENSDKAVEVLTQRVNGVEAKQVVSDEYAAATRNGVIRLQSMMQPDMASLKRKLNEDFDAKLLAKHPRFSLISNASPAEGDD